MLKRVGMCVLLMVIGVNLGVLNWNMMTTRDRANEIQAVSEVRDVMVYQDLAHRLAQHENRLPDLVAEKMPSVVAIHMEYATRVNLYTGEPLHMSASGVVIHESGIILTAAHVVDGEMFRRASRFWVVFADGTEREIKRIAHTANMNPDIGVIWIDPDGLELQSVKLDWKVKLTQGEQVLVLGCPFGYDHSASTGIVSCSERMVEGPNEMELPFVQVDSPINGGNSGGPVFDMDGSLIGIVSWHHSDADGVDFLVPLREIARGLELLCPTIEVVLHGETQ